MTAYDLLFIVSVFLTAGALVRIVYLLLRRQRTAAAATATRIAAFVAAYAVVLVAVSLLAPRKLVPVGEPRCFDEWCITVTSAETKTRIGDVYATGVFHVVATRVSSRSRGRRQRENDVYPFLVDARGRRFEVSPSGQEALLGAGLAGDPLTSFVDPGASFESRLAFDLPADAVDVGFVKAAHGWFPRLFIINEPGSFLHRPTVVPLGGSVPSSRALAGDPHGQLVWAARTGDVATIRRLAASGVDLDASNAPALMVVFPDFDHIHWTALQHAVGKQQVDAVRVLLEWGADPDARQDGYTPLAIAAGSNDPAIARLLLDAGADANVNLTDDESNPLARLIAHVLGLSEHPSPKDVLRDMRARDVQSRR